MERESVRLTDRRAGRIRTRLPLTLAVKLTSGVKTTEPGTDIGSTCSLKVISMVWLGARSRVPLGGSTRITRGPSVSGGPPVGGLSAAQCQSKAAQGNAVTNRADRRI